jgi:hypothetical protein
MATSSPTTDRSTAGATNGVTHTGTPNRSANVSTFPKPNKKVRATMTPTISVTADSTPDRAPYRSTPQPPRPAVHTTNHDRSARTARQNPARTCPRSAREVSYTTTERDIVRHM